MADWQLTTLRALGLTEQGLADSTPPAPLSAPHDPLTAPPAPQAQPVPRTPGDQAGAYTAQSTAPAPHDPLTAPPAPSEQAAPRTPNDQAGALAGAYAGQTSPAPHDPLTASPEQAAPRITGDPTSSPAGAYTAQSATPAPHDPLTASPEQAVPQTPGDQAGAYTAQNVISAPHDPLTAPPAPHGQAAPLTPGDQTSNPAGAYATQSTTSAPHDPLASHGQAAPLLPGDQTSNPAGAYTAQNVASATPGQVVSQVPGDQAGAYAGGVPGYGNVPGAGVPPVGAAFGVHQGPPPGEAVWAQGANQPVAPIVGELMRRTRHGDPLARRVGRGVRRAVGARAAQTVREQEAAAAILSQVVSSCRRIAVTSLRGGAGKTTVAALVARTIAAHRADRTLVVDADPSLGSLPLRLGVNAERAYRGLTTLPNWEAAQSYLTQAGERLWVASASASFALSQELDLAELQTALGEFSRYFGITLIDCGPGLTSELHEGILASSHAQILIAPATVDGALSTRSALDWFLRGSHAHLLQRTVVVLVTHTPHVDGDLNRSRALLAAEGVPVIHLPYDRHLAAGTALDPDLLAETSQATAVHLATAAFTRANA